MSVNEKIIAALAPLGLPVTPDKYDGQGSAYITFNYSAYGRLFADDAPYIDAYLIQVHLFAPYARNMLYTRGEIRRRLFGAGFTWPKETNVGLDTRAGDSDMQHIVFECEVEETVNLNG